MYRQLKSLPMKHLHTLGITPSRLKPRWPMTLFLNLHLPSPNPPLHLGKLQRCRLNFLQHSGQQHMTAAFYHVVVLLVWTVIWRIVLIAMNHVLIPKAGHNDNSPMLHSSHGSRPSTKTKSLDIPCSIKVNTNMMAPTSGMLWMVETISSFRDTMLPSMVSLALTSTLKIIRTLLSACQLMDFAHFGSAKKPAGQSWSITTTWVWRFISGSITFCVLALFPVHANPKTLTHSFGHCLSEVFPMISNTDPMVITILHCLIDLTW